VDAQYATLSLVLWNADRRVFTIAAAGTLPPLICRKGEIVEVTVSGVPIGLLDDQLYDQVQFQAEPSDLVLFYSDGVEDQLADDNLDYGRDRLEKVVLAHSKETPQKIASAIFNDIDAFRNATPLTDDQSVVALRVL